MYLITLSFTVDLVFGRRKLLKLVLFGSLIIKGNVGSKRKKKKWNNEYNINDCFFHLFYIDDYLLFTLIDQDIFRCIGMMCLNEINHFKDFNNEINHFKDYTMNSPLVSFCIGFWHSIGFLPIKKY